VWQALFFINQIPTAVPEKPDCDTMRSCYRRALSISHGASMTILRNYD